MHGRRRCLRDTGSVPPAHVRDPKSHECELHAGGHVVPIAGTIANEEDLVISKLRKRYDAGMRVAARAHMNRFTISASSGNSTASPALSSFIFLPAGTRSGAGKR